MDPVVTTIFARSETAPRTRRAASIVGAFVLAETSDAGVQRAASPAVLVAAVARLNAIVTPGEHLSVDGLDRITVRLDTANVVLGRRRIHELIRFLVADAFIVGGRRVHVDVGSAWSSIAANDEARVHATAALAQQNLENRDLMLRRLNGRLSGRRSNPLLTVGEVTLTYALSLVLPFLVLISAASAGFDISGIVYWVLVASLAATAALQWAEATYAIRPRRVPDAPDRPAPKATAIIAAYLPNEADTILESLGHFLSQEYSGGLQVILAYNTPHPLPVEDELKALAARNPSLTLVPVAGSRSKAQNVNAALSAVEGEFVGIFDADHHPMPGAFERAWRWIASGVDVVQGHCVIRNGNDSFVAKMISVEFEQIYAVSHPGRQLLHGFGVFGGSNGYWNVQVLREIRLRRLYLTEDIDASIRTVREGRTIINDPGLLSRELAPTTLMTLTKQRMRWAQGWFQVTLRHIHSVAIDTRMTPRQRRGMAVLLGWREIYLWLSGLMPAVLAFFIWRDGTLEPTSTLLLITTVFTLSSGPIQIWFAYRLGAPEIRQHRGRWWAYLAFAMFFYQEYKNFLGRLSQVKHIVGERHWAVTPRIRSVVKVKTRTVAVRS